MKHPFSASKAKIRRAKKLITELDTEIAAFLATNPAKCSAEILTAPDGRQQVTISMSAEPVPEEIGLIVGDVIHNLRAALDLMACDLVRAKHSNDKSVYFPFCEQPEDLDKMVKQKNFNRAGPEAITLLHQLKPYRGGNAALRAIHDLDVQDKHQSLIPALMGFASPVISLWDDDGTRNLSIVGDSTKATDYKLTFPSMNALAGQAIVPTLHDLVQLTDGVVETFRALANADITGT